MLLGFYLLVIFIFAFALFKIDNINDDYVGPILVISFFTFVLISIFTFGSYFGHINDIGIVRGQHFVIEVQEQRIESLQTRLTSLSDPMGKKQVLLNADSPFTSLITELASAEADLAKARTTKALALRDIEKRKIGPFWFIVKWVPVEE